MTTLVRHVHLREIGYCNRGSREWFARQGLNWADFVENGIDGEKLRATGDAMAARLVDHAEQVNERGSSGQQ